MQSKDLKLFLLNDKIISISDLERDGYTPNHILLDFIRYKQNLPGTKIGCREGDCGACTVLIGQIDENDEMVYRSIVSCLTPVSNVFGKHVVTIEGINLTDKLTIVQENLVKEGGTQCGACTPGFIVSLTNLLISNKPITDKSINLNLDGNVCRCTGYKSIEKAANNLVQLVNFNGLDLHAAVEKEVIPGYFLEIKSKLKILISEFEGIQADDNAQSHYIGGGTDLFVQKPDFMVEQNLIPLGKQTELSYVKRDGDYIRIGGSTTFSTLMDSDILQELFPKIIDDFSLIASTPIRNIATLGGNIVNASPIADTVIYFLVLNPIITLTKDKSTREVNLLDFYLGYKQIDKSDGEIITELSFEVPRGNYKFNFEKVSKRTYLDIASVNSALYIELNASNQIDVCHISAGGVAPVPKYLRNSSNLLLNKSVSNQLVRELLKVVDEEITPISDIRGSVEYKRLLLRQLVLAHFLTLFPDELQMEEILI
ncbi:MAG: 2Fe-2S iron-sulfur cluster binding domain-containing protein [Candidatus Heimdallarchaeota archaeon]|nr:2Fe-2S iron-sulfur cluster binding domain-containing protein [Candidatus Heimdallarchaeota archaeon]